MRPEALPAPALTCGDSCERFALYAGALADLAHAEGRSGAWFVLALARRCANVDFGALGRPRRFWRMLRQEPPICFGPRGFRAGLVDDFHPARHYSAFVLVGFFLPGPLARAFGWLWEWAEGVALGQFSPRDVGLSRLAARHGRAVRQRGPAALPALIRADLCEATAGTDSTAARALPSYSAHAPDRPPSQPAGS